MRPLLSVAAALALYLGAAGTSLASSDVAGAQGVGAAVRAKVTDLFARSDSAPSLADRLRARGGQGLVAPEASAAFEPSASGPVLPAAPSARSPSPPPPPPVAETQTAPPSLPAGSPAAEAPGPVAALDRPPVYKDGIYILERDLYESVAGNAIRVIGAPFFFDRKDWLIASGIIAGTSALFLFDEEIQDFWRDEVATSGTTDFRKAIEDAGDAPTLFAASAGAYVLAELFGARREKAAALLTLESVALTAGTVSIIKGLTGRKRPTDAVTGFNEPIEFEGYGDFNSSFPSAHSAQAFAAASAIAHVYGDQNPWVPWVIYPAASFVSLSRIDEDRHWASDVFLGAAIGWAIGKMVVEHNPFVEGKDVKLTPFARDGSAGARLAFSF